MKLDEHVPVHVPEPEHLEYHAPSDDDIQDTREPSEDFDETEPFEEEETVVTPPPRHHGARMSVRPQTRMAASTKALMDAFDAGSSPFPLPPTSPAYDQAPLGTEGVVNLSQWLKKMESVFHISGCIVDNQVKFATCTLLGAALTWWNGHVRTLGYDATYAMTWGTLKKKMTDNNCPKGEIKKLEIELWNLRVNGNDVAAYTQRFQELALMCTKFLVDETENVDKYIGGIPDNIHGNVMSARPKTLDETIELANDLMDKKLRTYAERQNDNKRKTDDLSKNSQQQQPHKKQNVARAYTTGPG
nr:reverse transcriptase domain-containing protein [Tanacetum cinerariifolium]